MKKLFVALLVLSFVLITFMGAAKETDSFVLKGDGAAEKFNVICPKDCNGLIKDFAEVFAERLSEITGAEVSAEVDTASLSSAYPFPKIYIGEEYDNRLYVEYLRSQNNGFLPFMPASEEEWDMYCGASSMYSMYVENNSLHINASDEWTLYCAIENFLNQLKSAETFVVNNSINFFTDESYEIPDPTDIIGKGKNPYFAVIEKVAENPTYVPGIKISEYNKSLQGGGTDGKYAYLGSDGPGDLGVIYKYSLPDWELIDVSDPILIKHVNAISYIEEKNLLTAAHCTDGDVRGFAYVDPDTLEVVGYGETPIDCWGLEYDNSKERFLVEVNWRNYNFDKDFNLIKEMPYGDRDGTPQTLYVDREYIYDIRYNVFWDTGHSRSTPDPKLGQNYITVHDYENVYIEKAPIPNVVGEVEHMFRHGNRYYIGYVANKVKGNTNPYGTVYEFIMLPEIWWGE